MIQGFSIKNLERNFFPIVQYTYFQPCVFDARVSTQCSRSLAVGEGFYYQVCTHWSFPTLQAYAVNLIDGITQTDIFEKFASSECIPLEFVKTEIKFEKAVLQHSLILNVCKARLL